MKMLTFSVENNNFDGFYQSFFEKVKKKTRIYDSEKILGNFKKSSSLLHKIYVFSLFKD